MQQQKLTKSSEFIEKLEQQIKENLISRKNKGQGSERETVIQTKT